MPVWYPAEVRLLRPNRRALRAISRLRSDERGQDLIEYSLLAALIALAVLAGYQQVQMAVNQRTDATTAALLADPRQDSMTVNATSSAAHDDASELSVGSGPAKHAQAESSLDGRKVIFGAIVVFVIVGGGLAYYTRP